MGSAVEEVTDGEVPFLGLDYDLTSPTAMAAVVVTAIIAMTIYSMASQIGGHLATRINQFIGQVSPWGNPATGQSESSGPAFGGS